MSGSSMLRRYTFQPRRGTVTLFLNRLANGPFKRRVGSKYRSAADSAAHCR
ncbi:hypothetical protein [Streptomyces fragilis]|uniref:Uncharacterized protein n=1 Tax=Streptomyces fragilis TaxID=67301 RepID=A0ABV2YKW5_9ACTN